MSSFIDTLKIKHDGILANCDTDSISFCKSDMSFIAPEERLELLAELNAQFPEKIKFSDDGYFETVVVVAAKNYALWDGKKVKIKGASLKSGSKELALKEFTNEFLHILLGII